MEKAPAIQDNARQMPFCALQLCLSMAALPAVAVTVSLLSHGRKIEIYMYFQILHVVFYLQIPSPKNNNMLLLFKHGSPSQQPSFGFTLF